MNIQTITNTDDLRPLFLPQSLYLKPLAKLNISVSLPNNKMGKSISNLDIMDKLTNALKPDKFLMLKVVKSTVEFIRFEAEMDERSKLKRALSRLDGISLKINGFSTSFKVRASEAKDDFPTRYDWDTFFRDATHMDEMKAGERPDTIHFSYLPIRWFCPRHMENNNDVKPSENIFKRIFEKFGSVRCVDIPICDSFRSKMNSDISGMKTFSADQDFFFEGYVQFEEYVGFVKAMDEFRGMKLVRKFVDKTQAINITVDFDKTKHLSDANIQRRDRVRKRLLSKVQAEKDEEEKRKKAEQEKIENERKKEEQLKILELERQQQREEKRKEKRIRKMQEKGQLEISHKIRMEEKKLLIAQRKLESIRILGELFTRLKLKKSLERKTKSKTEQITQKKESSNYLGPVDLRDKLVEKYKCATEKMVTKQKEKLQEIKGKASIVGLVHRIRKNENEKTKRTNASATSDDNSSAEENGSEIMKKKSKVADLSSSSSQESNAKDLDTNVAMNPFKMSMFPYVQSVFPGMPVFRPNIVSPMFPMSMYRPNYNYRGYAPRSRGIRGRGGGGYDMYSNHTSTYQRNYRRDSDSRNRSRSRGSRSRSYSKSRSRKKYNSKRSRSRDRSYKHRSFSSSSSRSSTSKPRKHRSHSTSRSRSWSSRSRTRHRSRSERPSKNSKTKQQRGNSSARSSKRLVSTRRSYSSGSSASRSSRSHERRLSSSSKHKSRNHNKSYNNVDHSRRSSKHSNTPLTQNNEDSEKQLLIDKAPHIHSSPQESEKGLQLSPNRS